MVSVRWIVAVTLGTLVGCDGGEGEGGTDALASGSSSSDGDGSGASDAAPSGSDDSSAGDSGQTDPPDGSTSGGTGPGETGGSTTSPGSTGADTGQPIGGPAGSCGAGGTVGEIVQVTLDSPERWYLLGAQDSDEPLPLVVAFHGDEGDPNNSTRFIWGNWWEQNDPPMHVVMTKCPGCTSWYQGDTDANAQYVWDVLADVAANHNVDVSRIYAVGYSGGSEFLSMHGWEFQDIFAGIQFTCGGNAYLPYTPPPRDDCKVAGRIVISQDDFLWESAQDLLARLQTEGHEHEYVDAQCSGHCCNTADYNQGAWDWFQTLTKCGGEVPGECAEIDALPPAAGAAELGLTASTASRVPSTESQPPSHGGVDFRSAQSRFDDVMKELERQEDVDEALFREAMAAYDLMLAAASQRGPSAVEALRDRYPALRAHMSRLRR